MIRTLLLQVIGGILRFLPPSAPEFIYTTLLRGPLRTVTNRIILSVLPAYTTLPEGQVLLNPHDPIVSGALAFGVYEPYETEVFRATVRPGNTIIDIGANIGHYAIIAAGRTGPSGTVVAFEPEPTNHATLKRSIEHNRFTNITLHQLAIADKDGVLPLNLYDSNKGKHSLVKDRSDSRGFSEIIEVQVTTLDAFLAKQGITKIDIIKMDIEGAESLALKGMQRALTLCTSLFLEFTPHSIRKAGDDPKAVLTGLRQHGFTLYLIDERKKTLVKITDDVAAVASIRAGLAANLLCKKEG